MASAGGPEVRPYPWSEREHVARVALDYRVDLVRRLDAAVDAERLLAGARGRLGDDVAVRATPLREHPAAESDATAADGPAIVVRWPAAGLRCRVWPEADLVSLAVARLLGEDFQLGFADAGLDATLRGAAAALLLDLARSAARGDAPEIGDEPSASAGGYALSTRLSVWVEGKPYGLRVQFERLFTKRPLVPPEVPVALAKLGDLPLAVPWVGAVSEARVSELSALGLGDVWLPGQGWFDPERPGAAGVLAGPHDRVGLPVRVSDGKTVLGPETTPIAREVESSMSREQSDVSQLVGETPVVVRLEVGALEMSAAEWAALRPGDVVQTGRRIDEPVVLRAAGREIARGELVDVEGEVGVRITHVTGQSSS